MVSTHLCPSVRKLLFRACVLSVFAAPLLVSAAARADFDADRDQVMDSADAYPCDASATAVVFAPAQGEHGFMLFEDQWPFDTDLDFNDLALSYNYIFQVNNAGQVVKMKATFNALAVGGIFNNGFALQLPVSTTSVASVTRTVGTQAPQMLSPVPTESQLTVQLSSNARELFGGQAQQINSDPTRAPLQGEPLVLEITFRTPVSLDTGAAPFDLFIFRSEAPSHEIHRPEFPGTRAMDQSLFGQGYDGSGNGRNFVNRQGLPYALNLPTLTDWPKEGKPISDIFPRIVEFASSAGRSAQDFYRTGTQSQNMYVPPGGLVRPQPRFMGPNSVPAETGCVQAWGLAVDFGSSRNQFAYGSTMDSNGDVYVTGYTRGAFPGFTNAGGLDLYVAKYDGDTGAELWVQQFGGASDETGRDIAIDSSGDIYVTGETSSSLDSTNAGGMDAFVMKLNASGVRQWTRQLGGSGQDTGYGVAVNALGEVFIGGGSTSANLSGGVYPGNTPNSFLAKYSASGTRIWVQQYRTDLANSSNYSYTTDIAIDPISGGVYSVGVERRYNRHASAAENQYLVKHSGTDGALLWSQHIGDYGYNLGTGDHQYAFAAGVSADNYDGSAYVTGHWYGGSSNTVWGEWTRRAGDTSADATIIKFSAGGAQQWTYTLASPTGGDDFAEAVVTRGELSGVYFTGRTNGSLQGFTNQGGFDYFISAYSYQGNSRWLIQDGTAANDVGHVATFDTRTVAGSNTYLSTYVIKVVGNTTGALGGSDQGTYEVGIYQHNYLTGEQGATVYASKLGWTSGAWSSCSASCGGGTQTRSVACKRADGVTVPDSFCVETKPASSLACNTAPCFTYAWSSGSWGSCSASCGGGTQSRSVYCQRSDGAQVADSYCSGSKPGTSQSCNTQACYTYAWYSGSWGGCSASCGGGTQSRTVYCQRSDSVSVADSYCTETKPTLVQNCNTQSCGNSSTSPDTSCKTLLARGNTTSGVYWIDPDGSGGQAAYQAWCDMTTDGGGWIVYYRRAGYNLSWERDWAAYKNGFGDPAGEYWLGNEKVYQFTSRFSSEQRMDTDAGLWSKYLTFALGSESTGYRLTQTNFAGGNPSSDGMAWHNGMGFTTLDRDYDGASGVNCSSHSHGAGWWFNCCWGSCLTCDRFFTSEQRPYDAGSWPGYNGVNGTAASYARLKMREKS